MIGARGALLPYLALLVTALLWSGNWIVGRAIYQDVPPVALAFLRWVLAAVVFLPFVARGLWEQRAVVAGEWKRLAVFSLIGVTAFNALVYYGLRTTTSINGSLLNAGVPIFIIVISWAGLGERNSWRQGIGVAVSLVGAVTIISRGDMRALVALDLGAGDLVIFFAIFLWALYSVLLRHWPSALTPLNFLAAIMVGGIAMLLPAFVIERWLGGEINLTARSVGGIAYLAFFASIGAYICWNFGVRAIGAGKASLFLHLIPAFATVLAMIMLGEVLRLYHLAGVGLILAGIYVATAKRPFWQRA
jgi:drug/metabolite transporter (DMT)-like permease